MIVITKSRESFKDNFNYKWKPYDEFIQDAFSEEGYDPQDDIYIDINALKDFPEYDYTAETLFNALDGDPTINWFSLNGEMPEFGQDAQNPVEDWRDHLSETNENDQSPEIDEAEDQNNQEVDHEESVETEEQNTGTLNDVSSGDQDVKAKTLGEIQGLFNSSEEDEAETVDDNKEAAVIVFGSSKGGTGKTFTAVMSTYHYAKEHPKEKIALIDFDLIDGQLGISIHRNKKTMRMYYNDYNSGNSDFKTMHKYVTKSDRFSNNLDFYLAPSNGQVVDDDEFWFNVIENLVSNYDLVVFDTGIDYLNIKPIANAYLSADKINLVTTTSIKSVTSVTKQISKLKGETPNPTYQKEDGLGPRINVIITRMVPGESMNETVEKQLKSKANIIAKFGVIDKSVSQAEYFGKWNVYDNNQAFKDTFADIMRH